MDGWKTDVIEWRDIPGYEGYQASNDGQVRSLSRIQIRGKKQYPIQGQLLTPKFMRGYWWVGLGSGNWKTIHRIVCLTFHGEPPEGKPYALHDDGDVDNNHESNLYWGSPLDNSADRRRHSRDRGWRGTHGRNKIT